MLQGKAYDELYDNHKRRRDVTTLQTDYGAATQAPLAKCAITGYGGNRVLKRELESLRNPEISLKQIEPQKSITKLYKIDRPFAQYSPQMPDLSERYQPEIVDASAHMTLHPAGRGNLLPTKMMKNHSNLWTM